MEKSISNLKPNLISSPLAHYQHFLLNVTKIHYSLHLICQHLVVSYHWQDNNDQDTKGDKMSLTKTNNCWKKYLGVKVISGGNYPMAF